MKTVLILSGGLDSTVLLAHLIDEQHEVHVLSIDYGQRYKKELAAAARIAKHYGVEHRIVDLSGLRPLLAGSSQTDDAVSVPHGHYAAESMKLTVVPNRNMLLLATAAAWAISLKADAIAYGAHSGDHAIYPDCRGEFVDAMDRAFTLCDWHPVRILRPFVGISKAEIAALGHRLGAPMGLSWSCYEGENSTALDVVRATNVRKHSNLPASLTRRRTPMYRISKQFEFSASHQLDHLASTHQCSRLHGHNYLVEVVIESPLLDDRGFCQVDYGEFAPFKRYLDETLDHRHLNDVLPVRTTAENLARFLYDEARKISLFVIEVRVSETQKTWASYRG